MEKFIVAEHRFRKEALASVTRAYGGKNDQIQHSMTFIRSHKNSSVDFFREFCRIGSFLLITRNSRTKSLLENRNLLVSRGHSQ